MTPKKKNPDDDPDFEDEDDPFNLGEEFYEILDEQMKNMFKAFSGFVPPNIDPRSFRKIFNTMLKNMKDINFDPDQLKNMNPDDLKKFMASNKMGMKGPFVYGMNFGFGPDGKPIANSFGNVTSKPEGDSEIKMERDPLIDIYEEDIDGKPHLVVVAEVPGVQKANIELKASPFELEIVASSPENEKPARNYRKIIPLPSEIKPDVAKARYNNGILEVRLEMDPSKKSKKKIQID
ncbi:MAG: Hsp20 family protein [Promethearchaeota archaeon]